MTPARAYFLLLLIIYLGFISLGLPDGSLGAAWPPMHRELGLPIGVAGVIIVVGTLLSGVTAFSSGKIIARFSTGPVVLVSCVLTGSALMTIAHARGLAWLIAAAIPLGLGAGAVDASLNGYVARHYTGRHMNWLHACWGVGATCGPLIIGQALSLGAGWRGGFFAIASAQLSLALLFLVTLKLWKQVPERTVAISVENGGPQLPTTPAKSLAGGLSVAAFIVYVGVEMTTGLWAGSILVESRGFAVETAARCVAAYYGSITAGRIVIGFIVERFGNRRLIALGIALAIVAAIGFGLSATPTSALLALIALGLGLAPVYPCLMHEVPRRFAPEAVQTIIGRQSGAAALGSATFPPAAGWLAGFSLEGIVWGVVAGAIVLLGLTRRLDRIT